MSLILPTPAPQELPKMAALKIQRLGEQNFQILLRAWENAMQTLWGNPDKTAGILAALGTDAARQFQLSSATVAYLETLSEGCTAKGLALITRQFTIHQDGTVTLNE